MIANTYLFFCQKASGETPVWTARRLFSYAEPVSHKDIK